MARHDNSGVMTIGLIIKNDNDEDVDVIIDVEYDVSGEYWAGDYNNPPEYPDYEFTFISAREDSKNPTPLTESQIAECESFIYSTEGYDSLVEKYDNNERYECDDEPPDDRYDD